MKITMKNGIRILTGLALAQVILLALTHLGGNSLAQHTADKSMLSFDKAEVDQVTIKGTNGFGDKAKPITLKLHKQDGKWLTSDNFPVAPGKLDSLLDKLTTLKHGLPVTTSTAALKRFKVAGDDFERQIQLQHGDKTLATLYIGSGAGARQSHARSSADTAVYTINLASYNAPLKDEDWQDHGLLKLDSKQISQVTLDKLNFKPDPDTAKKGDLVIWQATHLPEGKMVNQKAINDSLKSLASLSFSKVLGKDKKTEYGLDKPALTLKVIHQGKPRQYTFGKLKAGKDQKSNNNDYVLKVSDRDEYFQVASYTVMPLLEGISKDKWLLDKVPETTAETSTPDNIHSLSNTDKNKATETSIKTGTK